VPKPRYHAALSIALAGLVVARTHRWRDALPVLAAGVLVDVDHLVDLLANRTSATPRWTILPLHAWEWVFALLLRHTRRTDGLAGGLAAHLALDQLNPVISHPLFYWITVRARHGFRVREPLVNPERYARASGWMKQRPAEWF
jgi:hypothetical protein